MLTLSFIFPAGRYHATPWDRHVNEAVVAWPPEPWRLLRALIATWHQKVKYSGHHHETTLQALIEDLAEELPQYTLPAASHSHTRHYMPQWKPGKTSLVFDAFTAVARNDPLYMTWPHLELHKTQMALLDDLLAVVGYLGRAESWVEAKRVSMSPTCNCLPGDRTFDRSTGELHGEVVTLLAPLPIEEYRKLRDRFLSDERAAKKLGSTLPESLLEAISVETSDLRKHGWSQPPAARKVGYLRPVDALRPIRAPQKSTSPKFTTVRYLLIGKPLPRVEDGLRIGELLRMAVMSQGKRELGERGIPPILSGHGLPEGNRHRHAFYVPWDLNEDGRIDRLLLHVPAGMGPTERRIVENLRRIWSRDGGEWRLVLETIGDTDAGGALTAQSSEWQSVTPYLHPWHVKNGFSVADQIHRECRERGLPEPSAIHRLESIRVGNQLRRPIHFQRFRKKRSLDQPDRHGGFWRLSFPEPVTGVLAFGYGCHYGLGLFAPST